MPKARRKQERSGQQELQSRFRAERSCLHRSSQDAIFPYTFSFSFLPQSTQRPQRVLDSVCPLRSRRSQRLVRRQFCILISNFHIFSNRHFDTADDIGDNLPGGRTAVLCLGSQEDAVRQHIRDKPQHVVGNYKISLLEKCASPGCARQH